MPKITIYLPDETNDELDAKLEGRSRSLVLRKLAEGFIRGEFKIDWRREP